MARVRKTKRQHSESAPEQRARVLHTGVYDGSASSSDFVVSGHSSGSPHSEMEALSHQVSIDAGRVPDYPVNDGYIDTKPRGLGATAEVGDSPQLYGPNPPLTGDGSEGLNEIQEEFDSSLSSYKKIALWSSLGLAGAALGYLAYKRRGCLQ